MGRHSDGLTNYKFSTHVYVVIACLVVAVIIIVFWVKAIHGDSTTDKSKCLAGDLTVKIASSAGAESLATNIIDQYNAKKPVVRDHCITAEATKSLAEASAYITDESDGVAAQAVTQAQRAPAQAAAEWPIVQVMKVGIASTERDVSREKLTDVTYPVKDNAMASALVAASLNNNSVDATKQALTKDKSVTVASAVQDGKKFIVVNETSAPANYTFTEIKDVVQPVRVVSLTATDTVAEDAVRAGADLGSSMVNADAGKQATSVTSLAATQALQQFDTEANSAAPASPAPAPAPEAQPQAAASAVTSANTLFLFDTSAAMAQASDDGRTWFQVVSNAIAQAVPMVGAQHQVALWNYSSPLNPGVKKGWRENVSFASSMTNEQIGNTAIGFTTGGVPQTRAATVAAVNYATSYAKESGQPARVVLVTTGTSDLGDMSAVTQALSAAKAAKVELSVVHVGTGTQDSELMKAAQASEVVTTADNVAYVIEKLSGVK